MISEKERLKMEERLNKKLEVRRRLEEISRLKRIKKGFLTGERKKKLKKLLLLKASEDLKQQQKLLAEERHQFLLTKCEILPSNWETFDLDNLTKLAEELRAKILELESINYNQQQAYKSNAFKLNELTAAVNVLRGKLFEKLHKQIVCKVDYRPKLKHIQME